jgi:hypothetical protein
VNGESGGNAEPVDSKECRVIVDRKAMWDRWVPLVLPVLLVPLVRRESVDQQEKRVIAVIAEKWVREVKGVSGVKRDRRVIVVKRENGVSAVKRATRETKDRMVLLAQSVLLVLLVLLVRVVKEVNAVVTASRVLLASVARRVRRATRATVVFLESLAL